jgi:hypothetical protein
VRRKAIAVVVLAVLFASCRQASPVPRFSEQEAATKSCEWFRSATNGEQRDLMQLLAPHPLNRVIESDARLRIESKCADTPTRPVKDVITDVNNNEVYRNNGGAGWCVVPKCTPG